MDGQVRVLAASIPAFRASRAEASPVVPGDGPDPGTRRPDSVGRSGSGGHRKVGARRRPRRLGGHLGHVDLVVEVPNVPTPVASPVQGLQRRNLLRRRPQMRRPAHPAIHQRPGSPRLVARRPSPKGPRRHPKNRGPKRLRHQPLLPPAVHLLESLLPRPALQLRPAHRSSSVSVSNRTDYSLPKTGQIMCSEHRRLPIGQGSAYH